MGDGGALAGRARFHDRQVLQSQAHVHRNAAAVRAGAPLGGAAPGNLITVSRCVEGCVQGRCARAGGPPEGADWHVSCNPLGLVRRVSRGFGCCAGQVCAGSQWANIGRTFSPPPTMTALSFIFKRNFTEALLGFERVGRLAAD